MDDEPMVLLRLNGNDYHLVSAKEAVAMCYAQDFKDLTDEEVKAAMIIKIHDVDLGKWDRSA